MTSSKLSIAFLVVGVVLLLGLFVIGSAFSTREGGAGCGVLPTSDEERAALREKWFAPARVTLDELADAGVQACHVKNGRLELSKQCQLAVPASSLSPQRDLVLRSAQLLEAKLQMPVDDGKTIEVGGELKPGKDLSLPIGEDGGTISLACRTTPICYVALVTKREPANP